MKITRDKEGLHVSAPDYQLDLREKQLRATLSARGRTWTNLSLLASVDAGSPDESYGTPEIEVRDSGDELEVRVHARSTVWKQRITVLRAHETGVDLHVEVEGNDRVHDVTLGGGRAIYPNGACGIFRSGIGFNSLFVPTPTEPVATVRPAEASAFLGVVGDAEPGRLHAVFSPPPLCFAFGSALAPLGTQIPTDGQWCGMLVLGKVETLSMTSVAYEPLDGGWLVRMPFEGHTLVHGHWSSPTLRFMAVDSAQQAVTALLQAEGSDEKRDRPQWWLRPLFCGWGAQCAANAAINRAGDDGASQGLVGGMTAAGAPGLSRQILYDRWLGILESHDVPTGTVVIDDRWQASYGTCEVDEEKWPDLKGWIAKQHHKGRRVLLWFKAWDPAGLAVGECITAPDGTALAADPGSSAYVAHLEKIVHYLLSAGGLDADGFKVDFTQRAPSGTALQAHTEGLWGISALHRLMSVLHAAAHSVKPDALVVNHTVDPRFASVTDMVRLNDILERNIHGEVVPAAQQLHFRADVVKAANPRTPIDTDQWPISDKAQWLGYVQEQPLLGVPSLYYVESIDGSGEAITDADLAVVARSWRLGEGVN
jgi:hypothetical protein